MYQLSAASYHSSKKLSTETLLCYKTGYNASVISIKDILLENTDNPSMILCGFILLSCFRRTFDITDGLINIFLVSLLKAVKNRHPVLLFLRDSLLSKRSTLVYFPLYHIRKMFTTFLVACIAVTKVTTPFMFTIRLFLAAVLLH